MDDLMDTGSTGTEAHSAVDQSRRNFLKGSGGLTLSLSLSMFGSGLVPGFVKEAMAGTQSASYASWEDVYRREWKWDKTTWGSHTNVCWPIGSCKFHIYVRNGIVWREEQAANSPACNDSYPDYNPLGCQKGAAFNNNLYGNERVKYPLRRVGERAEGKWKRISWDEALTEIADCILDSHLTQGSDGFVYDAPHVHAGCVATAGGFRMNALLDGVCPDTQGSIGDCYIGSFHTFGKMHHGYSSDNLLDAELIFMSHSNWSYTYPSGYHFLTEARYKGAEVAVIAPDFSPTTPATDIHVPVKIGCDAAFWLGVCRVMISENLVQKDFVREQTDLPILVRKDNGHFLTAEDMEGGHPRQFYHFDEVSKSLKKASRKTLKLDYTPTLEGVFTVKLKNGTEVQVEPAFERLKVHLEDYTPEKASAKSGVPVSLIKELGRKVATKRCCSYVGFTAAKSYHGDLMERSMYLAMALSGNWGKPGTGLVIWTYPEDHMYFLPAMTKTVAEGGMAELRAMQDGFSKQLYAADPDMNDELAYIEWAKLGTAEMGIVPAAMWFYSQVGFSRLWDNRSWDDPALKQSFGDYLKEAVAKGWYTDMHLRPKAGKQAEVMMLLNNNPIRRVRSGSKMYPEVMFPKLKMLFTLETRMSATAMYCDIVLPCAWYYEKHDTTGPCTANPFFTYIDRSVAPPGECKEEWEALALILKKVGERATARGMTEFTDHNGHKRRYDQLYAKFTMNEQLVTNEQVLREMVMVNEATGVFPKGITYEQYRKEGQIRVHGMGEGITKYASANEFDPKKPFWSFRWHTEEKKIFPTQARRAQFYFDHEWYMDAGEAFPVHKEPPPIGGNHPFKITGGHPRVSIHAVHLSNSHLSRLHRGQPVVHMNDQDAAELGIKDGDMVKIFNDVSGFEVMARTAPNVQPKQCIVYMWEAYQYKEWKNQDGLLIGLPKALHMAGGYEQFRYFSMNGSPCATTDRGVRVSIQKI